MPKEPRTLNASRPFELQPRVKDPARTGPVGRPRKYPKGESPHDQMPAYTPEQRLELDRILMETAARLRKRTKIALDEPTIASIEALVLEGNWPHVAAQSLGITDKQYRTWYSAGEEQVLRGQADERDPYGLQADLYLRVSQATAQWETATVAELEAHIRSSSAMWAARMTQLERRDPSRWGRREFHGASTQTWEDQVRAYLRGREDAARDSART